jgi:hypothetical protein
VSDLDETGQEPVDWTGQHQPLVKGTTESLVIGCGCSTLVFVLALLLAMAIDGIRFL